MAYNDDFEVGSFGYFTKLNTSIECVLCWLSVVYNHKQLFWIEPNNLKQKVGIEPAGERMSNEFCRGTE